MNQLRRPAPRHRDLLLFGPLLTATLGCAPAVPQEIVVPAIPVSTIPPPSTTKPEAAPPPPPEVPDEDPPAPLQAAKVLTAPEPPQELDVADLTDAIVGNGVGGVMGGVVGGVVGSPPPPLASLPYATPAHARAPGKPCTFPKEADDDQVDEAKVILRVTVEPAGSVSAAQVVRDPGHGFGRAARTCALGYKFDPAKDANGAAVKSQTLLVIRFQR